jgi:hypothetical protein
MIRIAQHGKEPLEDAVLVRGHNRHALPATGNALPVRHRGPILDLFRIARDQGAIQPLRLPSGNNVPQADLSLLSLAITTMKSLQRASDLILLPAFTENLSLLPLTCGRSLQRGSFDRVTRVMNRVTSKGAGRDFRELGFIIASMPSNLIKVENVCRKWVASRWSARATISQALPAIIFVPPIQAACPTLQDVIARDASRA